MSAFLGQTGSGGLSAAVLQQSDDRAMPKHFRWDYDGGRDQLDAWADGMLWPRSRFGGCDGSAATALFGNEAMTSGRYESDSSDCCGGAQVKKLIGTTLDSTGAALGSCVVSGFVTSTNVCVGSVTSDTAGYYELPTTYAGVAHRIDAYKAGSPDVAGSTVNTLIPV